MSRAHSAPSMGREAFLANRTRLLPAPEPPVRVRETCRTAPTGSYVEQNAPIDSTARRVNGSSSLDALAATDPEEAKAAGGAPVARRHGRFGGNL